MKNNPNKGEISNFNKIAKQLFPNWLTQQISLLTQKSCCDNEILDVTYDCDEGAYVATIQNPIVDESGPAEITAFLMGFAGGDPEIIAGPTFNLVGKTITFPGILVTGEFTFLMFLSYGSPSGFSISRNKSIGVAYGFSNSPDNPITISACP